MSGGDLTAFVEAFAQLRALVVGDAMLDVYLEGESTRLSAEAPVPIVAVSARGDLPGGAANTAANVRALGATVTLASVVGDDREAGLVRDALAGRDVSADGVVTEPGRVTHVKSRVLSGAQMLVRFDQGSTGAVTSDSEETLIALLADAWSGCDAVVVSDYGYGVVTPRVIATFAELQGLAPRVVLVDAKDLRAYRDVGATAVKPNYSQALALLGEPVAEARRVDLIAAEGERILDLTGAQVAAVTLDAEGALVVERGRPAYRTYARRSPDSRAMGAGDTFAATLALALAAGAHTPAAAELASAAAGIVVAKHGTALCSADELRDAIAGARKYARDRDRLQAVLAAHREHGRRIVFTNGCFDILHRGHITYLSRAKTLGDVLVVGLNSDESVARLKGPGRPVNTLAFDEDTPISLIEDVRPDVFVKGGDYTREMLPEARVVEEFGGTVQLLPYVEDRSTSGIIERIREVDAPPAYRP
jgi:D-beta-D-heptose 7-phosphate kinase / D-beta-D-heptose 1-phosphate adenosyltransferase